MHFHFPSWIELNKKTSEFEQKVAEKIGDLKANHPLAAASMHALFSVLPYPLNEIVSNMFFSFDPSYPDRTDEILKYVDQIRRGGQENYDKITSQLEKMTETLDVKDVMQNKITLEKITKILVSSGDMANQKLDDLKSDFKRLEDKMDQANETANYTKATTTETNERVKRIEEMVEQLAKTNLEHYKQFGIKPQIEMDQKIVIPNDTMSEIKKRDEEINRLNRELELVRKQTVYDFDYLILTANAYFYSKDYEKALTIYDLILQKDENNVIAINNKGATLGFLKRPDEALYWFEKTLTIKPDYTHAFFNLGKTYDDMGDHEKALFFYDKALQIEPNDIPTLNGIGVALAQLKKYEEAIIFFSQVLEFQPDHIDAVYNKGLALQNLGRVNEAIVCFEMVLKKQPLATDVLEHIGTCLFQLEKYEKALPYFEMVLKKGPVDFIKLFNMGLVLFRLQRYREAIPFLDQMLEMQPNNVGIIVNKAEILAILGDAKKSFPLLIKAIRLEPAVLDYVRNNDHFNLLKKDKQFQELSG